MKATKYIYLLLLSLAAAACGKFIEDTPKGSLIPRTVDDMGMILDNTTEIIPGMANTIGYSNDIKGLDNLVTGYTQADINAATFKDFLYGQNENDGDWNRIYHSIYLCNFIVNNIQDAPEGVDKLHNRNYVSGGALFHRAYSYFLLVNAYAKHYNPASAGVDPGVPLLLNPDINAVVDRATVQAVYNQIIQDVQQAAEQLPLSAEFSFRPTRYSAYALLATVYLYQGRFTESWKEAEKVTAIKNIKDYNTVTRNVATDPRSGFKGLDAMEWKREDVLYYRETKGMFRNFYFITNDFLNSYDKTNDLRFLLFLTNAVQATYGAWGMDKTTGILTGDVYLTEAEAKLRDMNVPVTQALTLLNKFIDARYKTAYPDITITDRTQLKQRVLAERRKEFAYRGMRLFDIKRLQVQDNVQENLVSVFQSQTFTIPSGTGKTIMPIPLNVIAKSNIEQNPRQ